MITLLVILAFMDVCLREFSVLFGSFTFGWITKNELILQCQTFSKEWLLKCFLCWNIGCNVYLLFDNIDSEILVYTRKMGSMYNHTMNIQIHISYSKSDRKETVNYN